MNDLGVIAAGAGLHDGLNPCMFMACAVFILYVLWIRKNALRTGFLCLVFALVYGLCLLIFNFGPAQIVPFNKLFTYIAKILYFIFGLGALIIGLLFLKEWFLLFRHKEDDQPSTGSTASLAANRLLFEFAAIILAAIFGLLATLWPVDNYMMLLGNIALLKRQWQMLMPLLGTYMLTSMWPFWLVWAFISIKNLRPSLVKMFYASIFLIASSCMILIFN
jgi:hypothetical protein